MKWLASFLLVCRLVLELPAGTLTATFSPLASGSNVDLTTIGKLDWVHWGLQTASSVNRKAAVTPMISNFTLLGDPTDYVLDAYQFSDNSNSYSWYDGAPVESETNTTTGVWAYGYPMAVGSGFQITVPAGTSPKTLDVFVGAFAAEGQLTATLSDGSAPSFTSQSGATVNNRSNGPGGVFSIDYSADSPGQTLTVTWTLASVNGRPTQAPNVTLQAASLSAPGADNPPFVVVTNPVNAATAAEPAAFTLQAKAEDFDGTVTNVAYYAGTNELGQATAAPYTVTWSGAARGRYLVTAAATDNAGVTSWSSPVEVFVYGTGGSQTNSVAVPLPTVDLTSEGTADWTHWGLATNTSFDYKAGVPRQISNFTEIGTNSIQQYSDNYTAFSWSDGTPTPATNGTTTGIFVTGLDNGFELTAPADTSSRTLRVYVGGYGVQGEFQAYLSDLSAPPYTDTSVSNMYGNSYVVYTVNYQAASPGQQLNVIYRAQNLFDMQYGNVTLQSATLQGGQSVPLPVRLTNPRINGNALVFSFVTQPDHSYVVEHADALPAGSWTTLNTVVGTGGLVNVTNQDTGALQGYYRVETQ